MNMTAVFYYGKSALSSPVTHYHRPESVAYESSWLGWLHFTSY